MNKKLLVVLAAAFIGIAATIYYIQFQADSIVVNNDLSENTSSLDTTPVAETFSAAELSDDQSPKPMSLDSVAELQAALGLAVKEREDAEEALRVLELEVGALESQLDDIETRGDDPADVQDETLDSFQAMFANYQDTIMAYEEAAAKEEWIKSKLELLGK